MSYADIWNTPGYFYAVAYALSTIIVFLIQRPRLPAWHIWLRCVGIFAVLLVFMRLTEGAVGLCYVVSMLAIIAFIYLNIHCAIPNRCQAGFYCIKTFIYAEFSASLCWQIYYYLVARWEALWSWRWRLPIMLAILAAMNALFLGSEYRLRREGVNLQIGRRELLLAMLASSGVYVVSNLGYLAPGSLFSGSYARDIFAIRTLVDLSGVAIFYAFHSQLMEVQLRLEKDALHNIMCSQYQAHQLSKESIELVNQKYHDLKHQLVLLRSQAAGEKFEAYLGEMERELQCYETQVQTGNMVLDAILAAKSLYCLRHDIELKFITDGKLLDFMDDMEISALFGNMLDNAIESVERIPEPEKRLIRLYVGGENRFLRIRMENYCQERVRFENDMPVTSKRDKRYHGFGMKSMRNTVEKYGGSLLASQSGDWFELKILIPLERQATSSP